MPIAQHRPRRLAAVALLAATGAASTVRTASAAPMVDAADAVEPYERDVFVIVGATLRNPDPASTAPDAPLFNVAGVGLGITWGQWTGASATSAMRVRGGRTDTELAFSGLVPNGVYSVFYVTLGPDSENPLCPGVERALPLTSRDRRQQPDASSLVAGPDGSALYASRVDGDLLGAQQVYVELIYHLDGQTYGPLPNRGESLTQSSQPCRSSYGEDAMRQLLVVQKF